MATQTKTGSPLTRSRRKLNFGESQRFKGKTFFLDLVGYRRAKELEEELIARGATVEKFLDPKVRYVITNKSRDDKGKGTRWATASGQSPCTPSTGGLSQLMSPSSNQSSSSEKKAGVFKPPYHTRRAQQILQKSWEKERNCSGSSDVLALASSWKNCKILHVDAVEKELKQLGPLKGVSKNAGIQKAMNLASVRKLRKPFFKIEDLSHQYRPIIYEPSRWPVPNPQCSPRASPFDHPRPEVPEDELPKKVHRKEPANEKRMGFCEPCSVRFEDLEKHLKSSQHQEYACNSKNFEKLDRLIAQCANFKDFLTNLIQQHESENKNSNSPTKSLSPLRRNGLTICPDRVSMVSLPSRECPLVVLSDYPVQSLECSPGVCTRQMKRKLVESSPNLLPDHKKIRTSV